MSDAQRRAESTAAGREAQQRAEDHADPEWKADAAAAVVWCAHNLAEFTGDDVWDTGLRRPREPRALGPIMRKAAGAGMIEPTGRVETARFAFDNGGMKRVWRSLVYGQPIPGDGSYAPRTVAAPSPTLFDPPAPDPRASRFAG